MKNANVLSDFRAVEFNAYAAEMAARGRSCAVRLLDGSVMEGKPLDAIGGDYFIMGGGDFAQPADCIILSVWDGHSWRYASEFTDEGKEWAHHMRECDHTCPRGYSRFQWAEESMY